MMEQQKFLISDAAIEIGPSLGVIRHASSIICNVHNMFYFQLTMEKAPGCPNCDYPLYYTRAQGPNDTLHYIWDFAGKPTMFVALTEPNATAVFNWTDYAADKQSVGFDSTPEYTFALVFNKVRVIKLSVLF